MYRLNVIACYKPWRGSQTLYTTNKEVFDLFKAEEGASLENIEIPGDVDGYEYLEEHFTSDVSYPITITAEATIYTE